MKFGALELRFDPQVSPAPYPVSREAYLAHPNPVTEITEEQHDQMTRDAVEAEEVNLREDRLAQMFIEDPVRAEELLRDGELEDADEPESGDDE